MNSKKQPDIRSVSQGKKPFFKSIKIPRKRVITIVAALSAAILAGSAIYVYLYRPKALDFNTEKNRYNSMTRLANEAESKGDKATVRRVVREYLYTPPDDKNYLYDAETRLAQACYYLKDYKCASDAAQKALGASTNSKNYSLYEMLGNINLQLKNDQKAIEYYTKAIDNLKGIKNASTGARIDKLKLTIAFLESGRKP